MAHLYLVETYESYMASERGVLWVSKKPEDTTYYKHRIIEEAEFVIPSEIEDTDWDIVTENGNPFAVSANGIYKLKKA